MRESNRMNKAVSMSRTGGVESQSGRQIDENQMK